MWQDESVPPRSGDIGHGDYCMGFIEHGRCACEGCVGTLTDPATSEGGWGFCRSCGCAHKVQMINGTRYAAWVPAYGRCRIADEMVAGERRRQDQQARRRMLAEESGDPQR